MSSGSLPSIPDAYLRDLPVYRAFQASPFSSIKHTSYFQVYEALLSRFRGQKITFVEIGVLNGGSLFMWRDYFGPQARIIGIEYNPEAVRWREHGFEIFIGSQSDPQFWTRFFGEVGAVDVVLDDGGHTNEQQIVTVDQCLPYVKDGGLILVEDTCTSYIKGFGNPSRYSFVEWVKRLVDNINSRTDSVKRRDALPYKDSIFSISVFESIVAFHVDRTRCFQSGIVKNGGESSNAKDFARRDEEQRMGVVTRTFERWLPGVAQSKGYAKAKERWTRTVFRIRQYFRRGVLKRYF